MSKRDREKLPGSADKKKASDKNGSDKNSDKTAAKRPAARASVEPKRELAAAKSSAGKSAPPERPAFASAKETAVSKLPTSAKRAPAAPAVPAAWPTPQATPTVRVPASKADLRSRAEASTSAPRPARKSSLPPAVVTAPVAPRAPLLQPSAAAASDAATIAPPNKKRALNGSQHPTSRPPMTGTPASASANAPSDAQTSQGAGGGAPVESAASAEPALEQAASIAVASDRADSAQAARLARGSSGAVDRLREAAAFGSSQSLLSTDYYFRQYGAHGMRSLAAEVDDFGFDPHVDNKVKPLLEALCKRYFRVELVGAEHIPVAGRALLVANRAGALPWDGLVLRTALRSLRPALSPLRWLAEDSVIHYPFMGVFMNRLGAVRACPENAERLLAQDRLVAVFPEGAQGSRKLFRDRYRLQRFGRGGYVKLALKLGVPIFPTAIIGAEEINPVLGRSRLLGRVLGSDSVPLTPTFPWFGLAGLLPAPVRWRIAVGEAIDLSQYGPEAADDALIVHRLNEQIRSSLQALVDRGKSERGNALFG